MEVEWKAPFSVYVPILKHYESGDGKKWVVEGPLTEPSPDIEGDEMDPGKGIEKGLETFDNLGRIVDWEHGYERSLDPDFIIGYGVERFRAPHPGTGVEVPWLRTELHKDSKYAQKAVGLLNRGGKLGYSVAGGVVKRQGSKVLQPIVSTVGITARPIQSRNVGTLAFAKALSDAEAGVPFEELEFPMVPEFAEWLPSLKAITTGAELPRTGPTACAVAVEQMEGEKGNKRKRKKATGIQKALMALLADEIDALLAVR